MLIPARMLQAMDFVRDLLTSSQNGTTLFITILETGMRNALQLEQALFLFSQNLPRSVLRDSMDEYYESNAVAWWADKKPETRTVLAAEDVKTLGTLRTMGVECVHEVEPLHDPARFPECAQRNPIHILAGNGRIAACNYLLQTLQETRWQVDQYTWTPFDHLLHYFHPPKKLSVTNMDAPHIGDLSTMLGGQLYLTPATDEPSKQGPTAMDTSEDDEKKQGLAAMAAASSSSSTAVVPVTVTVGTIYEYKRKPLWEEPPSIPAAVQGEWKTVDVPVPDQRPHDGLLCLLLHIANNGAPVSDVQSQRHCQRMRKAIVRVVSEHWYNYESIIIRDDTPWDSLAAYQRDMELDAWPTVMELQILSTATGLTLHCIEEQSGLYQVYQPEVGIPFTDEPSADYGRWSAVLSYKGVSAKFRLQGHADADGTLKFRFEADEIDQLLLAKVLQDPTQVSPTTNTHSDALTSTIAGTECDMLRH